VTNDAVPAVSVGAELVITSLADDTEPVGVVHVQQSVVGAGEAREGWEVDRVSGHAVDAVDADQTRGRTVLLEKPLQIIRIFELEPLECGAASTC